LSQLAFLAATFSYAIALMWARRFRGLPPVVPAAGQLIGSSLLAIPMALVIDTPWALPLPSIEVIASVIALALASTALAYRIYFTLMARNGAGNAALVTMLIPPSAMLMGWGVLGETPTLPALAGFAVILLGLALVDGRLFRR